MAERCSMGDRVTVRWWRTSLAFGYQIRCVVVADDVLQGTRHVTG